MKNWTIVNHWTGGGYKATALDREHYNAIVEGDANVVYGDNTPDDQISTSDGIYGAHTRAFNTKCIGVSMACMAGAEESAAPPNYGSKYPVTREQFMQMCHVNARYCIEYDIPVTRETVLMHSEVQPNLGIWQKGKWDVNVLPFKPDLVGHRAVGDYMREVTQMAINEIQGGDGIVFNRKPAVRVRQSVLREGANGPEVAALQENLAALGFYLGRVDGDFGPNTESAVREFQRDYGLTVDGRAGPQTMGAITVAMHGRRDVSAPAAVATAGAVALPDPLLAKMEALIQNVDHKNSKTSIGAQILQVVSGGGMIKLATDFKEMTAGLDQGTVIALIAGCVIAFIYATYANRSRNSKGQDGRELRTALQAYGVLK